MFAVALRDSPPPAEPAVLALMVLAHVAGDDVMGPRFLDLTGMDSASLRAQADQPETLAAVLGYLMANEHDLVATADAIGVKPEALALAARKLGSDW
ncbi:DUF3572 family protein [Sandarakinorhabdus sp.]|uniref:DUF3572 family protein n=1 Tax=Sandarakinorhabdus sp. TaxID=1916663 RepID=UPI0033406C2F